MTDVVIDPGHGGARPLGGSSPHGARGRAGSLEKDVTLRLARRVAAHLGASSAKLTRDRDVNVSLADRAAAAARAGARVFVSLHANAGRPDDRGCETWVHSRAGADSVALARGVQEALASVCGPDRGVKAADLAVLRGDRLGQGTAACLVEVGFLSNPASEAQLADPRRIDVAARAIAGAVREHLASPMPRGGRVRFGSIIRAFDTYSRGFEAYGPPDPRPYTPSAAFPFRCPPTPPAVSVATEWPQTTNDPDVASEAALRALGVNDAGIAGYRGLGFDALRPIAQVFGQAALTELLGRLRYSAAQLTRPPHSYGDLKHLRSATNAGMTEQAALAVRLLLAIPGHFRELAREASTEQEAHAVENIGWLLMQSLAGDVGSRTGMSWWLPSSPIFVTPFPNPLPPMSAQATSLVTAQGLIDTTLEYGDYNARFAAWSTPQAGRASPGRAWRLETGLEASSQGPAMPFYTQLITIPAAVNIAAQRAQVQAAWTQRLSDFDAGTNTKALNECDNHYLSGLGLTVANALSGLELVTEFPAAASHRVVRSLTGLSAIQTAWELAFQTVRDLGWNDLLFQTGGMLCFRGTKIQGNPAALRRMSNHSSGTAGDFNDFENRQMSAAGSMDPRIVALFEALNFRWGQCFRNAQNNPIPDPMHFEYS
jgi:N-acetylmuramoyl-L-alanine amidase